MQQIPSDWKQCSTCAYWTGSRTTDTFGRIVYVESSTTTYGQCAHPSYSCGWKGQRRQACGPACNCYQKWPVLK